MILVFSDVHLGLRRYSTIDSTGLFTAENEARIALEQIYQRASKNDIEQIICCGDMFHTSHPTPKNIEFLISWIQCMETLEKPFTIITGNHDVSTHSNSMVFMHELNLQYTVLVDSFNDKIQAGLPCVMRYGEEDETCWIIHYIPYLPFETSKDKNKPTFDAINKVLSKVEGRTIIVAHAYDSEVTVGSESTMISRYAETVEFNDFENQHEVILLLGHAHKYQSYTKKNGMKVIFPGSIFYHDLADVNQEKGYILLDENGNTTFEKIMGIREFVLYTVPSGENIVDYFSNFRLSANSFVFVNADEGEKIRENELRELLKTKGCGLDKIRHNVDGIRFDKISVDLTTSDPFVQFDEHAVKLLTERKELDKLDVIQTVGRQYLEKVGRKVTNVKNDI